MRSSHLQPLPVGEPFRYYQYGVAHGASRWLRRSRSCLLWRAARLDPDGRSTCSGTRCSCVFLIHAPVRAAARASERQAWWASHPRCGSTTSVRRRRCFRLLLSRAHKAGAQLSALSAMPSMLARANSECVASRAFFNSRSSNMAAWLRTMPVRRGAGTARSGVSLRTPLSGAQSTGSSHSAAESIHFIRELSQYRDLIQQRINFERNPIHEPNRTQSCLGATLRA